MTKLFQNGNTWPSIITILLTINIILLGFVIGRLDKTVDALDKTNENVIGNKKDIINIKENYAKREWVIRNFMPIPRRLSEP